MTSAFNLFPEDLSVSAALSQSSTKKSIVHSPMLGSSYEDRVPELAVDGNTGTCTETEVENATWWRATMEDEYYIHTVVLQAGLTFGCKLLTRGTYCTTYEIRIYAAREHERTGHTLQQITWLNSCICFSFFFLKGI